MIRESRLELGACVKFACVLCDAPPKKRFGLRVSEVRASKSGLRFQMSMLVKDKGKLK